MQCIATPFCQANVPGIPVHLDLPAETDSLRETPGGLTGCFFFHKLFSCFLHARVDISRNSAWQPITFNNKQPGEDIDFSFLRTRLLRLALDRG